MKNSDLHFLKLFHNNLVGMIITGEDHIIVDANDHLLSLADMERSDVVGKTGLEVGFLNEIFVKEIWQQLMEDGRVSGRELSFTTKKNKKLDMLFSTERIKLEDENYWLTMLIDISSRKKNEQRIEESELRFRTLTRHAPVGIFETDAAGLTTYVNKTWMEFTGLSFNEATGDGFLKAIHPEDRETQIRNWENKTAKSEPSFSEYRMVDKAGKERWINGNAIPVINEAGAVTGYIGTISDVTAIKKSEQVLQERTKQLKELSTHLQNVREDERMNIAREIHDELGQQLTGLKMDIAWLMKKAGKEDPVIKSKFEDTLRLIDETVRSIRRIATELRPSIIDDLGLNAALEWLVSEFNERLNIQIRYENDFDDKNIDPDMSIGLFRILQESLTNIARHANAKSVAIIIKKSENAVKLTVEDDGVGFDSTLKQSHLTFGLLGIRERTYMMQGEYAIFTKPGNGTKIEVCIPMS